MSESKYTGRPNLLRVATEIAKFTNPDKVLEILKSILKGGIDNLANSK